MIALYPLMKRNNIESSPGTLNVRGRSQTSRLFCDYVLLFHGEFISRQHGETEMKSFSEFLVKSSFQHLGASARVSSAVLCVTHSDMTSVSNLLGLQNFL